MYSSGDVLLCSVQFTDSFEVKARPAVVLFEEFGNIIVAGITSNQQMKGISLTKKDGAIVDSVIKTNYIMTISENAVKKKLFVLSKQKKQELFEQLVKKLNALK
ncbi:MAG: type II toxin-antitoxin system PemK/MazF family toxin [Candidatus Micrarchaeota archaeon]